MKADSEKRIIGICGSLRKGSFNRILLKAAQENAPIGMKIELYEEMASIPLFNEDLELETGGAPEVVRRLRDQVKQSHGILIVTPEYNQSIPGVLKNTIDWLSRFAPDDILDGKPVAIMGATPGRWGTRLSQAATRQTLFSTGTLLLPTPMMFVGEVAKLIDKDDRLIDERTLASLKKVLIAFSSWIELLENRASQSR
ncbi:NAD(P)H-dependent oxidoreductase [Candidatus Acetothermia bacterium]|nr:NAD(P)H-dependent oxidoreductase [Candidatus Acetothermia bacterium]MBI3644309.1 NAD(P)H-dependent oxidoreductase [Candidatus Acetothermia bacterium]